MSEISIADLEVFYRIGVTDQERARPQRLLLTVDLRFDFSSAASTDRLEETVDYAKVVERLLGFGQTRTWNLLEKLVADLAEAILRDYPVASVSIEAKKFVVPQARYIAVRVERCR